MKKNYSLLHLMLRKKLMNIDRFFTLRNCYGNEVVTSQFMYIRYTIFDILLILMVYIYVDNTILIYTIWF